MQKSDKGVPAVCIYKPTDTTVKWSTEDDMAALTAPHAVLDYEGLLNRSLETVR